jgi:hypothetical protein
MKKRMTNGSNERRWRSCVLKRKEIEITNEFVKEPGLTPELSATQLIIKYNMLHLTFACDYIKEFIS